MLTTSQDWWPADFGHYGPFMIRMAWHSAGTYRISDGRGGAGAGQQRFAPLNSWPDNGNLDKARRLLWPVKQKYGQALSWADLMVLTGNVALESMGFETFGFAGGRPDVWEPDEDVYWGPETEWLGDERYTGERELEQPLGAVQMGLIYVNPEGPNGNPDPLAAAHDIRETFGRMAMNDEETVALIAGGHTFGKTHGAADPDEYVGPEPEGASLEEQGLGWKNTLRHRQGRGHDHQRARGHVDRDADPVGQRLLREPVRLRVGADQEPRRRPPVAAEGRRRRGHRARPGRGLRRCVPRRCSRPTSRSASTRIYEQISRRFHENPDELADAFARAWFKLTHRDMGPIQRYLGPEVPAETLIWQDPVPAVDHELIGARGHRRAEGADPRLGPDRLPARLRRRGRRRRRSAAATSAAAPTARASASSRSAAGRSTTPSSWRRCSAPSRASRPSFAKPVSLADLIVLGGSAAVEQAAKDGGVEVEVPFTPGRTDASAGADRRRLLRGAGADRGRVPQLPPRRAPAAGRVPPDRPREPADPERARDDRPGRRPARPGRERRRLVARRPHVDTRGR